MLGDRFKMTFRLKCRGDTDDGPELDLDPQVHDVVAALGGCVAEEGLYRVHTPIDVVKRTGMVEAAMPTCADASCASVKTGSADSLRLIGPASTAATISF